MKHYYFEVTYKFGEFTAKTDSHKLSVQSTDMIHAIANFKTWWEEKPRGDVSILSCVCQSEIVQPKELNIYNFEVYLKEPITHEEGWEIGHINVYAETLKQAREKLKSVPDFDCVILFNFEIPLNYGKGFSINTEDDLANYAHGNNYRFTSIGGETIIPQCYMDDDKETPNILFNLKAD